MSIPVLCLATVLAATPAARSGADTPAHPGWQGLRVIALSHALRDFVSADLDGDGRQEIVAVNVRQSRLEIYRWLAPGERKNVITLDPRDPNYLPMAEEFSRQELNLDDPPRDVAVADLDGDGRDELVILLLTRRRLLIYGLDDDDALTQRFELHLLDTPYGSGDNLLELEGQGAHTEAYVSSKKGLQRIRIQPDAKARWLEPKDGKDRRDWWFTDLDGDGDRDLLEWGSGQSGIRLRESIDSGRLLPPVKLDRASWLDAVVLPGTGGKSEVVALVKRPRGTVKRYRLARDESQPVGGRRVLPLPDNTGRRWCGVQVSGKPAVVYPDPKQPRIVVHVLGTQGFEGPQDFPGLGDVQSLAAPGGAPGTLLLWTKDAGDLHISRWQDGRFSYPRPFDVGLDDENRKVLGLGTAGSTVWWAQRDGTDVVLFTWTADGSEHEQTVFSEVGEKVERVTWLGGNRLLIKERFARGAKLAIQSGDAAAVVSQPAHLKSLELDQIRLLPVAAELRVARLHDGVLQWLDPSLHPRDQVMLGEGKQLGELVVTPDGTRWALERGGKHLQQLIADDAGILRQDQRWELPGGQSLRHDPVVGLVLENSDRITVLNEGAPWKLELIAQVDNRDGRPAGTREVTVHRIASVQADDVPGAELLLFDDVRRQATLLARDGDELVALISWPTYDDKSYPYGGVSGRDPVSEPRRIIGVNLDGDDRRDLAILSHDRLVIYLGREEQE